jgi:2,4-diaminopentanoate dehydrogenase
MYKVVLYGIGPLGARVAKVLLARPYVEVVGAIDLKNVGVDLGIVSGLDRATDIVIRDDAQRLLEEVEADVVIHATTSSLERAAPQIAACVRAGMNVITSCEELAFPHTSKSHSVTQLDALAKEHGKTILATGINPGFLMDKLPLVLAGACLDVTRIKVTRVVKSRVRRPSFQQKIGTGMQVEEFRRRIRDGSITGHVGLVESAAMVASGLGLRVDKVFELPVEPVICTREVIAYSDPSEREVFKVVRPGEVAGLQSAAHAVSAGDPVVILEFIAHANVDEPYDAISIVGTPNIEQKIVGGVDGDVGTIAILVNSIPRVVAAAPGFFTMKEMNPPTPLTAAPI